jgi:hypothetical protein
MSTELAVLAADHSRVADLEPEAVPPLLGELETLKARLWVRLQAPRTSAPTPTNGKGPDRWLDAEAVAERLGFVDDHGAPDRRRVYRRASGWKFARKVGGVWRFSEQGLVRWMVVQR